MHTQIRLLLQEQSDLGLHCLTMASKIYTQTTKADNICCDWRLKLIITICNPPAEFHCIKLDGGFYLTRIR